MPKYVGDKVYLTAAEAAKRLAVARETFNRNVGPRLRQYQFGALSRTYYLQSDIDTYSEPREILPEEENL